MQAFPLTGFFFKIVFDKNEPCEGSYLTKNYYSHFQGSVLCPVAQENRKGVCLHK